MDAQAGLDICCSQTPKTGFLMFSKVYDLAFSMGESVHNYSLIQDFEIDFL